MTLHKKFLAATALVILALMQGGPALAQLNVQQREAVQGIANPGRAGDQIDRRDAQPRAVPDINMSGAPAVSAPPGAENVRFTLNGLQVDGVTAYDDNTLRALYADRIGQTVSLTEVYEIAARITAMFRNDGYILTQVVVPPQTIDGGVPRLQVVEGFINRISVTLEEGARTEGAAAMELIRAYAGRISSGRALNARDLERYMLLINDLPGVSARGVLSPSPDVPGAADLTVLVSRDVFEAVVALDNYGTRYLGPVQLSGAMAMNSTMGGNERMTAQAVIAPHFGDDDKVELGYWALGYERPLMQNGLKMILGANYTMTNPGYTLDELGVEGHARFFSGALRYPVIRTRATSLFATFGFDHRSVATSNDFEETRKDRISALRAAARLEHLDTVFGAGLNVVNIELSQGTSLLGATRERDTNKSRAEADGIFTKLGFEMQRLQRLADRFNLLVGVRGQISDGPLLSSEEFGVGGFGYGRAFDPSEIIGDEGVAGKVELQWNIPGTFAITHSNQLFAFYDAGRIWNDDPAAPNLERDTITSTGFGVRSKIMDHTNMDMAVAFPLNRDVQTQGDDDPRFYFSLSRKF